VVATPSLGSFGRYQLLDVLGRGATGDVCEVFRAFDTEADRVVAIKLLSAQLAEDPEYRQWFEREAHVAAGLNDPHVVPIHSYGEIDGRLYVDMSLIEGLGLGALLAGEGGRLHPARAVAITEQVASALDSAHRAGLVHRDVKPSNILVGERDFAYLTDFGIARFTGTDPRADIYALACVLHECLTGQRSLPPPEPSTSWPDIPPAFDAVIARGTAENPDERYQTSTQLAEAARAALTGTPTTAAGPRPQAPTEFIPQFIPLPIQEWPAEPAAATAAPPKPASRSVRHADPRLSADRGRGGP
jgi:eukaryotic-like serine/threonine-protein kinase